MKVNLALWRWPNRPSRVAARQSRGQAARPLQRVTYAMAPEKDDMHVTADIVLVRKLAAMEQETDINQGPEGQTVQAILDKIASDVVAPKTSKREN